jgi:hypothetical protein
MVVGCGGILAAQIVQARAAFAATFVDGCENPS